MISANNEPHCSFCGKKNSEVKRLITGASSKIKICDECVSACNDIVNGVPREGWRDDPEAGAATVSPTEIPSPQDIWGCIARGEYWESKDTMPGGGALSEERVLVEALQVVVAAQDAMRGYKDDLKLPLDFFDSSEQGELVKARLIACGWYAQVRLKQTDGDYFLVTWPPRR